MSLKSLVALLLGLLLGLALPAAAVAQGLPDPPPVPAARSREYAAARSVDRRPGDHPASPRCRAEACRADQAARPPRLLQRPHLPPRHRRLHGPGRRSQGRRHRRLRPSRPPGRVQRPAPRPRRRLGGAHRAAEHGQQPVLHHALAASDARRPIYRLRPGHRRHELRRRDRERRAAGQSVADPAGLDRRRQSAAAADVGAGRRRRMRRRRSSARRRPRGHIAGPAVPAPPSIRLPDPPAPHPKPHGQ